MVLTGPRSGRAAKAAVAAGRLLAGLCCAWLGDGPGRTGAAETNLGPVAVWDTTLQVRIGGGYRENIMLSHVAPEGSALVSAEMDLSMIRLSETGSEFVFFLLGEDSEYAKREQVKGERLVSATAQWMQPLGERDKLGGEASYLYLNQVLDVSESQDALRRVLVEGHGMGVSPQWHHRFDGNWAADMELGGLRQVYAGDDLDDYWEAAAKFRLTRGYGHGSEAGLGLQSTHWIYDTRERKDANGRRLADTGLFYSRPEVFGEWRHSFDRKKRWRSTSKVGWLWNLDNGSGYYDYDRLSLAQTLRWRDRGWEISGGVRTAWYWYRVQQFAGEDRERWYLTLDLEAQRSLSRRLFLFARGEREWNRGTEPWDDYRDWRAVGGVGVDL